MKDILEQQNRHLEGIYKNAANDASIQKLQLVSQLKTDKDIRENDEIVIGLLTAINNSIISGLKNLGIQLKSLNIVGDKILKESQAANDSAFLRNEEKLESARRDEKQLTILEKLLEAFKSGQQSAKTDPKSFQLGGLGTGLAVVLGSLAGYLQGHVKAIKFFGELFVKGYKKLVDGINYVIDMFPSLRKKIDQIVDVFNSGYNLVRGVFLEFVNKISTTFKNFIPSIKSAFESFMNTNMMKAVTGLIDDIMNSKAVEALVSLFNKVKTFGASFIEPLTSLFKTLDDVSAPASKAFASIKNVASKAFASIKNVGAGVMDFFKTIGGKFEVFTKLFGSVSKVISKIAYPLTVILAVWDTVKGAIEGFEKDGIIGGIKGAITGLFNSLIGGLLDLVKDAVSWIAGALGFKSVEKALDSFSFQDVFKDAIDGMFSGIKGAITGLFNILIGGLLDLVKGVVSWIAGALGFDAVEKALDSFSFQDVFKDAIDGIFGVFDTISDLFDSAISWVTDKINSVKSFLGFDDGKESKAKKEYDTSSRRRQQFETASTLGAVGRQENGAISMSIVEKNGVFDKTAAEKRVANTGATLMSDKEIENEKDMLLRVEAEKKKAYEDLLSRPTIKKLWQSFTNALSDGMTWMSDKLGLSDVKKFLEGINLGDVMSGLKDMLLKPVSLMKDMFNTLVEGVDKNLIQPIQSMFEMISSSIEDNIGKPLKKMFEPVAAFFGNVKNRIVSFFEEFGIPEISFTIPVIGKKVSIGPFYPFRPEAGTEKVSTNSSTQAASSGTSEYSRTAQNIGVVGKKETTILNTDATEVGGSGKYSSTMVKFDTKTGKASYTNEDDPNNLKYDAPLTKGAFRDIKKASAAGAGSDTIKQIISEDEAYQKLSWFDKLKVDVGYSKASELAAQPMNESKIIYDRSKQNEDKRAQNQATVAPVIVNAPTTNVANNKQSIVMKAPMRNDDSNLFDYNMKRSAFL